LASVDPTVLALARIIAAALGVVAQPAAAVVTTSLANRHSRQIAREEHRQRRIEATYTDVSEYLIKIRDRVRRPLD
jgi:hypothetical protein